ncbi:MAG: tetratricopeptide repeat protein, partial [Candidatus Omnitrophica bacterium]|nr:tetratricopeptide repeat protein [Candidatus Omnitrophota bacterium]
MKIHKISLIVLILFLLTPCAMGALSQEEERFYVATKAFADNFYDASASLFERFLQEFPQSNRTYEAKLYIAKCQYFKENYPRVLALLNELAANPQAKSIHDEVYYWQAEVSFKGKNFKAASDYAYKLISDFPSSKFIWWAYYIIASSNAELNQRDKAMQVFEKIIKESPEKDVIEKAYGYLLDIYFRKNDFFQLEQLTKNYLRDFPKGSFEAQGYFYLGESAANQNKFEKGLEYYQRGLELSTSNYLTDIMHRGLGFLYLANGNAEEAKKNIDRIENDELRLFSQGTYFLKSKDYPAALEQFNEFIKKFPASEFLANAYLNQAATLYEMGRINDSITSYTYLIDKFKTDQSADLMDKAHYGLAWGYLKAAEFKKAIAEFEQTLKYTDNSVVKLSSQIQIADAYQEGEDYAKSLEIYKDILKSNPNTVYSDYIQFQIGMVFLKTKRMEESLLALRNLQKNFPSSHLLPEALYYLAVGYFSVEKYIEAQNLLEDFMTKYPFNELLPKAHYLYGKCLFNIKDYNAAIDVFKEVCEKYKNTEIEELATIDIGNAYLNLSLFDNAKKTWLQFLGKFPKSQYGASIALHLGGLYEKEENF